MARFKQYTIFKGSIELLNIIIKKMELDLQLDVLKIDYIDDEKYGITYQDNIQE